MEKTHGPNFLEDTFRHSYQGGNHRLLSSPSPQRIERYYGKSDCFPKPQPWRKYVRSTGREAEVAAPYIFSFSSTLFHPDFRWARKGSLWSRTWILEGRCQHTIVHIVMYFEHQAIKRRAKWDQITISFDFWHTVINWHIINEMSNPVPSWLLNTSLRCQRYSV